MAEEYITVSEAAEGYGISKSHLRYLLRKKKINGRKSGGTWILARSSVARYKQRVEELGKKKHGLRK